jgi:starvation-inducible outer membrane lipoprotein
MKTTTIRLFILILAATALQGCIAFPPLIQVEHKDAPQNQQEIIRRLDAIDHRLDALEQKADKK